MCHSSGGAVTHLTIICRPGRRAGVLAALKSYKHCKGILVYDEDAYVNTSAGWSPDASRPNADAGLPYVNLGVGRQKKYSHSN